MIYRLKQSLYSSRNPIDFASKKRHQVLPLLSLLGIIFAYVTAPHFLSCRPFSTSEESATDLLPVLLLNCLKPRQRPGWNRLKAIIAMEIMLHDELVEARDFGWE